MADKEKQELLFNLGSVIMYDANGVPAFGTMEVTQAAEVYYINGSQQTLLGNITGADDGFCPFKAGLYSVSSDGEMLYIEWCKSPEQKEQPWEKDSFTLPTA